LGGAWDLGGEIRTVSARSLGDTVLLWDGDSRLGGFAACHLGAATEAGEGTCLVKFGEIRCGPTRAGQRGAVRRAARMSSAPTLRLQWWIAALLIALALSRS